VLFLDADCLALRNIDHLLQGDWDIRCQPERGQSMCGGHFNAFLTDEELLRASSREGLNSGSLAVRATIFQEVMQEWGRLDAEPPIRNTGFHDQASWNKLVLNCKDYRESSGTATDTVAALQGSRRFPGITEPFRTGEVVPTNANESGVGLSCYLWRTENFPAGEIQFPCSLDPHYENYTKAALTHNLATDSLAKVEFTFGLYMRTFFCDPTGLFFNLLEM
jgi:hypothetical protein